MAEISREALREYRRRLDLACRGAGSTAREALSRWLSENPNASVEECREAAIEIANATIDTYGAAASANACDLYDEVMEAEGVDVPPAQAYGEVRERAVDRTIHRTVGRIDGTKASLESFVESVGRLAEDETRHIASTTMEENVKCASKTKKGKSIRFARVPTSALPCETCAMLASKGFAYKSAEGAMNATKLAGKLHVNSCMCTIVPGVKGKTAVEGYDPKYYEDVWRHPEKYRTEEQGTQPPDQDSIQPAPGESPADFRDRMIDSGMISTAVNPRKQAEHFEGTDEWNRRVSALPPGSMPPSSLSIGIDEVQELVDELGGSGQFRITQHKSGNVQVKETCTAPGRRIIGTWRNNKYATESETDSFVIMYSRSGSHIVPATPSWIEVSEIGE